MYLFISNILKWRPDKNYRISSTLLWSVKVVSSEQQQPAAARIFFIFLSTVGWAFTSKKLESDEGIILNINSNNGYHFTRDIVYKMSRKVR